jgi:FMN-dependent NADH-azoreductase
VPGSVDEPDSSPLTFSTNRTLVRLSATGKPRLRRHSKGITVPRLLHISSSPRGQASESLAIAAAFLEAYAEAHPGAEIDTFDLWDGSLPEFGPNAAAAKMAVFAGQAPTGAQAAAWQTATDTFHRVARATHYLFSVPMWNHGVPYILKQLIDVISQPGLVFNFDPEHGYTGLLTGRKAAVIYTGAVWGPDRGAAFGQDLQQPYFDGWLRWAGIDDITTIRFQPNLATPDAETGRQAAQAHAREAGKTF